MPVLDSPEGQRGVFVGGAATAGESQRREREIERENTHTHFLCTPEMAGGGGEVAGGLIPGLPEEIVLAHVVTRLPWFVRPVCRAVSKSWRASMDTSVKQPELQVKSRNHQLPLLDGCILIHTFDNHTFIAKDRIHSEELRAASFYRMQWQNETYQIHRQWRKLPPLQGLLPPPPANARILASSGMVYIWSKEEPEHFVMKMDMGCGDWTWNKVTIPHPFNENAVHFNGKIYVPQVSMGESANQDKEMVLVYDMVTDKCALVKAWNRDNLRVLCKKSSHASSHCEEEMYSFVEHEDLPEPKLEILVYDGGKDSWTTRDKIPIPECRWSWLPDVKLVNGDCFEPAPDVGINTIWVDSEGEVISWFNACLHEMWVEFNYNVFIEGKWLEYIQFIWGSLYGIFIEDKEDQEDEDEESKRVEEEDRRKDQQDPTLFKRTLMKGTMSVSGNIVNWEEVLDVGCFREAYYLNPSVVSPISHYTLMA
ncbi:hypothetical protein GOP47_0029703 [Adiantum capillus-veneris]|nr:hypothetical protein GOP47_0029703 [Adiantum capillus-veneris]